jgi:transposase-like protein
VPVPTVTRLPLTVLRSNARASRLSVMSVKDEAELLRDLDMIVETAGRAKELASARQESTRAAAESPGITVSELAERFGISEDALMAFVETVQELMGERPLDPQTARRAAMIAAADQAWENQLGPLLSSGLVRELLAGVSRQRVDELLKSRRLIGLRDSAGRRRFPAFQFADGRPLSALIDAFWTVAEGAVSDWTAASWCVARDEALKGRSPLQWARAGEDPERLQRTAVRDAARLSR